MFKILEEEVVPLYYQQDADGVPRGWISMVRETIRSISPRFCARRMVREYTEQLYVPASQQRLSFR